MVTPINVQGTTYGCVVHRRISRAPDGYVDPKTRVRWEGEWYRTLCNQWLPSWCYPVVENKEVTCVNCNKKLRRIADTKAAVGAHVERTQMRLLNKVSDTVHLVVRHWVFTNDFTFQTACGRYLKLGDAWKTPIIVDRPVTCSVCLRVLKARKRQGGVPH